MRRNARVDVNQSAIVKALRKLGASVLHLHSLGRGAPDVLVGFRGYNTLMEIKDGTKYKSRRLLTEDEDRFHAAWQGQVATVTTIEQALHVVMYPIQE